jgi:hypothetical protein
MTISASGSTLLFSTHFFPLSPLLLLLLLLLAALRIAPLASH